MATVFVFSLWTNTHPNLGQFQLVTSAVYTAVVTDKKLAFILLYRLYYNFLLKSAALVTTLYVIESVASEKQN